MSGNGAQQPSGDSSKEDGNATGNSNDRKPSIAQPDAASMLLLMRKILSTFESSSTAAASQENEENAAEEQGEPATQGRVVIRERVITKEQIGAFEDLGLGRGVDATNPTPWLNKSAFQVRQVTYDNIIGTEEGNLYQGFVNEVESTQNLQTSLKASIPLNQQVNLGIDSELSRSYSSTQKSVGRKIITRTIAFRANSDDVSEKSKTCQLSAGQKSDQEGKVEQGQQGKHHVKNGNDQDSAEESSTPESPEKKDQEVQKGGEAKGQAKWETFEDRLIAWIDQRIKDDDKIKEIEIGEVTGDDRGTQAEKNGNSKSFDECTVKELSELCYKFVKTFSITHYVHSLELGASHYRVMSEEEYTTKIRSKGSLGAAQMADIAIGFEGEQMSKKLKRQTTKIGRMKLHYGEDSRNHDEPKSQEDGATISPEEEVRRGSIDEAVVGVKVQPISTLVVKHVKLQRALQDALQYFIQNKQKIKYGPFFICCNRESIFLSVSDSHQIEATQDIQHASKFYIVRCDEGDDHFFIIHEAPTSLHDENVTKFEKMPPVPMYLKASMNWRRRSTPTKPLMMEMNVNSRLSIHSRRDKEFHPAKLTEWVSQKEVFFIRCEEQARLYRKTSYLCVYQPKGEAMYITGCKPNIRSDDNNRFMLFRLVKLKKDEVSMCAATTSIAPFIIKFRARDSGKDLFFEVSSDCQEVHTTEEKSKASTFHLKVEKCNYFRILYKKGDQVYYLHAPTKLVASRKQMLSLSLREDASAQSYMAFYYASDAPSHSRRLHQRELSDLIESSAEDKLHITCQRSADSNSRDASDLYVKQKVGDSFRIKVKRGKTKRLDKKEHKNADTAKKQNSEAKNADTDKKQNSEAKNADIDKEQNSEAKNADIDKEQNSEAKNAEEQNSEAKNADTDKKQTSESTHFTEFVLLRKDPIAPFIIKFQAHNSGKDLFFEVSSGCKEVRTTEERSKASKFYLKVEKSNYFKILYKTKRDQMDQVYHLYAPTKLAASSQLSLSLKEDASARSYMAFYYASNAPSHSRRLQQRELSDLIESSAEDKLHISCQRSVDCDSRDVGDLFVEQKENTFHVKVKQCTTKHLEEEHKSEANSTHFTGFVLQCSDSEQPSTTQTQPSSTDADPQSPATKDPKQKPSSAGVNSETPSTKGQKQISHSIDLEFGTPDVNSETQSSSTNMSSNTPSAEDSNQIPSSNGADSSATDSNQAPTDNTSHGYHSTEECESQHHPSTSANSKTPSGAGTPTGTDVHSNNIISSSTGKSSESSPAKDPEQALQPANINSNSNSAGTVSETSGTAPPSVPEDLPVGTATGASNGGGSSSSRCGIM